MSAPHAVTEVAPRHAFVVPAFERSPWLADCLASLRAQSRPSPIVVATPAPWDGMHALVEAHGARLAVNPAGGGIGRDWNFALAQSPAEWTTIAHQDDVYLPEFTARTMSVADSVDGASLVFTGYAELHDAGSRMHSPLLLVKRALIELGFLGRRSIRSVAAKRRTLRFGCPIPCPAVTLHRDRAALRFREDLRVNLDWAAWLDLAARPGAFAHVRTPLMLHRIHAASETSAGVRAGVRAREDLMMFESLWPHPLARILARVYALSYAVGEP